MVEIVKIKGHSLRANTTVFPKHLSEESQAFHVVFAKEPLALWKLQGTVQVKAPGGWFSHTALICAQQCCEGAKSCVVARR
eukprot:6459423-Amphidinium_carterae.2